MIIAHMSGGLGNQLYSFACGYALAKRKGVPFVIDTAIQDADWFFRNSEITKFNIECDKHISYKIGRTIPERAVLNKLRFRKAIGFNTKIYSEYELPAPAEEKYKILMRSKGTIYIKGNWGNQLYFRDYEKDIRRMFTLKEPLSEQADGLMKQIKNTKNSVGIHIRRGDYVKIGCAIQPDYYINAIDKIAEKIENPVFFCFSEDLNWSKEVFKAVPYEINYLDYHSENKDIEDFFLLSANKHMIASNSSYSWWAAYLNSNKEKIIVMPFDENTFWNKDFLLENCIALPFEQNGKT